MRSKVYTIYTYELIWISIYLRVILQLHHSHIFLLTSAFVCESVSLFVILLQLKHLKGKHEPLKPISPKKKNGFEYSDQGSNDLLEKEIFVSLAMDYRGLQRRKPPINN